MVHPGAMGATPPTLLTLAHAGIDVAYRDTALNGPRCPVVLVHGAGATSENWADLTATLAPQRRVLAPDLYAHGGTPRWPGTGEYTLDHPAALVEAVTGQVDGPVALVGHSWSGSICLHVARRALIEVERLVLIEPTLFAFLREDSQPDAWDDLAAVGNAIVDAGAARDYEGAARIFVEYLLGDGAWDWTPPRQQKATAALMEAELVRACAAQLTATLRLDDYRHLTVPTLVLRGTKTPEGIARVAELVAAGLPTARLEAIEGAGHLAPTTHPNAVHAAVQRFLA